DRGRGPNVALDPSARTDLIPPPIRGRLGGGTSTHPNPKKQKRAPKRPLKPDKPQNLLRGSADIDLGQQRGRVVLGDHEILEAQARISLGVDADIERLGLARDKRI